MPSSQQTTQQTMNRGLFLPYALPYLLYVGVGLIPEEYLPREAGYGLRLVLAGGALAWGWRSYVPLKGPRSTSGSILSGLVVGLAGTVVWIALVQPFAPTAEGAWTMGAFLLRALAAVLLVPLFEELLMRGYVLRLVVQRDAARTAGEAHPLDHALEEDSINDVAPGAWTPLAVVVSTVVFVLGHATHEWLAAVIYGLLMAGLWIRRKDLLSCVVAHAVTNLTLAIYVYQTGRWEFW